MEQVKSKIIDITPAMAERWLATKNIHNRKLYESTVNAYANDMKKGLWALNNQGIGFDDEGDLIDGQHRLQAIVWSGKTIRMLTVSGLPKNFYDGHFTQETIDRGKTRGAGDFFKLTANTENGNLRAAIIRGIISAINNNTSGRISFGIIAEVNKIFEKEINAVVEKRQSVRGLLFAPVLSAFVFAAKLYLNEVMDFQDKYFNGTKLDKGDPPLTLRNFMLSRGSNQGGGLYRKTIQDYAFTCLMHFILGNKITRWVSSYQGKDFFINKQPKIINQVIDLLKY